MFELVWQDAARCMAVAIARSRGGGSREGRHSAKKNNGRGARSTESRLRSARKWLDPPVTLAK